MTTGGKDGRDTDPDADTQAPETPTPSPTPPTRGAISTQDTLAAGSASSPGGATAGDALPEVARGHYEIGNELARGGMGRILVARDRRIGRPVALKELLGDGDGLAARFAREALVTGRLQHPAIVPVYEAGRWPTGEPFYAMKLVSGKSLERVIGEKRTFEERLALLPNVIHIAEAMAYAHGERVIHRDLKPANVLVGAFGETVVIDWGLAKDLRDTATPDVAAGPFRGRPSGELTMMGSVMGTPMYMPPEQANGDPVDERADVYALGAILHHVLSGRTPYTGKTAEDILTQVSLGPPPPIAKLAPGVPGELATIVEKAMARAPGDRYPTAKELAEELVRFQAGQLVSAHRYSAFALVRRFVRRHRAAVIAAAALVVLGGAIGVVSLRQIVKARDRATAALARAERERRAFLEEQGRQELLAGNGPRAAVYLSEAYAAGDDRDILRLMLAAAMEPLDAMLAKVDTGGPVVTIVPSPDGRGFATTGAGKVALWTADGAPIARLSTDLREVTAVRYSPDGSRVAVAGRGESVTIWDARAGAKLFALDGTDGVAAIAWAPDGKRLYTVGEVKVTAWDVPSGQPLATSDLFYAREIAVSSDGARVVAVRAGGTIAVLDAATLATLGDREIGGEGTAVAISANGARMLVAARVAKDAAPRFDVVDLHAPDQPAATIDLGAAAAVALDADGGRALVRKAGEDDAIALVRTSDGHTLAAYPGGVVAMTPDGTRVAIADEDGVLWLYDDDGRLLASLPGHRHKVNALEFSADGKRLYSGGEGGLRVWGAPTIDTRRLAPTGRISEDAASPDGTRVVAMIDDTDAVVYDVATGAVVARLAGADRLWSAHYAPDGTHVMTTTATGHVILWDVATARRTATIDTIAISARFSPDGARLLTAGEEDAIVWDAATGAKLVRLAGTDDLVMSARWSADGTRVVTAAQDGVARVYDARSGALQLTLAGHTDYLVDAAFDPRGARIVTASGDGKGGLWDAAAGARLATLGGHTTALHAASFSPDGTLVLTIGSDGGRVWNAATGAILVALPSHEEIVGGQFLAEGRLVVTSSDARATIWETTSGVPILTLPPREPRRGHAPSVTIGHPFQPIHDPRARRDAIVEAPDGAWLLTAMDDVSLRLLPREHRPPGEITRLVAARSSWREQDGALVPTQDSAVYRTEERAEAEGGEAQYTFEDDLIQADTLKPDADPMVLVTGPLPFAAPKTDAGDKEWKAWKAKVHAYLPVLHQEADRPDATEDALAHTAAAEEAWGSMTAAMALEDRLLAAYPTSAHVVERKIHRAFVAIGVGRDFALARKLVAGIDHAPDVGVAWLYELGWVRRWLGDTAGAYATLLAAAAHWRRADGSLRAELFWMASDLALAPDDVVAAIAATPAAQGVERAALLEQASATYGDLGEIELQDKALAELVTIAKPAVVVRARAQQAKNAMAAGRMRELAAHALEALALVDDPHQAIPDDVKQDVIGTVYALEAQAHRIYLVSMDERYARVALRVETVYLAGDGRDDKQLRAAYEDLETLIGSGPSRVGRYDQEMIRYAFRKRTDRLRRCYTHVLAGEPDVRGHVSLKIFIRGGKVTKAVPTPPAATSGLGAVAACMAEEAMHLVLPHAAYAPAIAIDYPFVLDAGG